jgi:phosphotransferase system HPr (HPr) family protein
MNTQGIKLTASELQAIEEHKYYLSQRRSREVPIEEAIEDFVRSYAAAWRREKLRRDNLAQMQEIEKHKYFRSMAEGRDIGRATAAEEWCRQYAHIWRGERESLARNGFVQSVVHVQAPEGLHLRPTSDLADLAARYDADVYVHKDAMPYYNFILGDKPFMNVRSVLGLLSLGIRCGDRLELIATGRQASEALAALTAAIAAPACMSEICV